MLRIDVLRHPHDVMGAVTVFRRAGGEGVEVNVAIEYSGNDEVTTRRLC